MVPALVGYLIVRVKVPALVGYFLIVRVKAPGLVGYFLIVRVKASGLVGYFHTRIFGPSATPYQEVRSAAHIVLGPPIYSL